MYQERRSRLQGGVVWRRITTEGEVRILPDGCMDLIWTSDGELLVAGPDTSPHVFTSRPGLFLVGLRLAPGIGPLVLGVPARELRDQRLPLDMIWRSADASRLAEQLGGATYPGRTLEAAAEARLDQAARSVPMIVEVVRLLRSGRGVADVAEAVGLSERQLRRRSLARSDTVRRPWPASSGSLGRSI